MIILLGISTNAKVYGQTDYQLGKKATNTPIALQADCWIPTGKLAQTFDPAPALGLTLGQRLKWPNLGVFFNGFWPSSRTFNLKVPGDKIETTSNFGLSAGMDLSYEMPLHRAAGFDFLATSFGVGGTEIFTKDSDGRKESFGVIHMHFAVAILRRMANGDFIGLRVQYNFAPQRSDKRVDHGFGSSSLNIGLEYRLQFFSN